VGSGGSFLTFDGRLVNVDLTVRDHFGTLGAIRRTAKSEPEIRGDLALPDPDDQVQRPDFEVRRSMGHT
jgi:hypothetical protein